MTTAAKRTVVFDFMRTLYDPLTAKLYPGVSAMLEELKGTRRMLLYSRKERSRHELLQELGIDGCFEAAYFVDTKDATNLLQILVSHNIDPKQCIVVGDIVEAELSAGKAIGADTVLLQQSYFGGSGGDTSIPTHTVGSIDDLRSLLSRID